MKVFLYRTGFDGKSPHTLFETALQFDYSHNQVFRIERQIATAIYEATQSNPESLVEVAKEFKVKLQVVERVVNEYPEKITKWKESEGRRNARLKANYAV